MNTLRQAVRAAAMDEVGQTGEGFGGCRFRFDGDFIGFSGHFPGYPLLPAFVQVLLSVIVMEDLKKISLEVSSIDNAKFQKEIRPNDVITVECQEITNRPFLTFRTRITRGADVVATFLVRCSETKRENR